MSIGLRARRAITGTLTTLGPDSEITRAVVKRTCAQRGIACTFTTNYVALKKGLCEIRLPLNQTMFAPYIASYFDTFADSVTGETSNSGFRVVDFSTPRLHHYVQFDAGFELPSFPESIDFAEEYFRRGAPAEGSLVFDLGANVGLVSYALSRAVGSTGSVIAFEPDPVSLDYLARNLARHSCDNVTVVSAAISDTRGTLDFFCRGDNHIWSGVNA